MFEKLSKRFASKATDGAVEGVRETLNDKFDQYGDMIKIGLVFVVVALGGKHLTKKDKPAENHYPQPVEYYRLPSGNQPIIVNNYYQSDYGQYNRGYDSRRERRNEYNHGYERRNQKNR